MKILLSLLVVVFASQSFAATYVCGSQSKKYRVELTWTSTLQKLLVVRNATVLVEALNQKIKTSQEDGRNHYRARQGSYAVDFYFIANGGPQFSGILNLAGGDDNEEEDQAVMSCQIKN